MGSSDCLLLEGGERVQQDQGPHGNCVKLLTGLAKDSECRAPAAWKILRLVFLQKLDAKLEKGSRGSGPSCGCQYQQNGMRWWWSVVVPASLNTKKNTFFGKSTPSLSEAKLYLQSTHMEPQRISSKKPPWHDMEHEGASHTCDCLKLLGVVHIMSF